MIKSILTVLLITCSSILIAGNDHIEAKRLLDSGDILPLESILKKVRTIHQGKILEIEFESEHGQKIYEIELLTTDGNVLELKIDAVTGKLLSTEKEH
ncbi:MAG: PepSY domain-containing protein [Gammaproteobacteria bacterium]|nr:PepSY domain-containing protein [Gammaproteobacteria bacterium]